MSGTIGGVGSRSGVIGSIGRRYSGNLSQFIDKTNPFFGANLNGSSNWNNADFDTNTGQFARWWDYGTYDHDRLMQYLSILFGPDYTASDDANGGWRLGMKFQSPVEIVGVRILPVKTNARVRWLGLYKMDDTSGTNRTYVPTRYCTSLYGGVRSHSNLTIFGASTSFPELATRDDLHYSSYEPTTSQYWMWSFGNSVNADGNNNAGIGGMQIMGSIVL